MNQDDTMPKSGDHRPPPPLTRSQREAAALRDNLAKRKAQARQRQAERAPESEP